ncbi:hypothetical protein Tco_1467820 [Tanacetum coccineum]
MIGVDGGDNGVIVDDGGFDVHMHMEKKDHVDTHSGIKVLEICPFSLTSSILAISSLPPFMVHDAVDRCLSMITLNVPNIIARLLPTESIIGVQKKEVYVAHLNKRSGHLSSKVMVDQDHKANPLET